MEQELRIVTTADGSTTLWNEQVGEHYHSKHGALQESKHVFLKSGLQYFLEQQERQTVSLLEVGFGTGLNFLLTVDYCLQQGQQLDYVGIEAFPIKKELLEQTGYGNFVSPPTWQGLLNNYEKALQEEVQVNERARLFIDQTQLMQFESTKHFDVLYFDAFAAIHQPEMWTTEALAQCCNYLKRDGVFVTYAITGNLKRSMKSLGFRIEKAPGAPGKREMLRATKL
ncbi:tRNA (5-methylaminomethyl-2-thiouridine)(34)-methyltransferase MnmD [Pedobacter sp. SYSU D00535]|uniref:tRNA (5-methylaminomethyl-2-thiouridine)(34)-methyltransferase MnmD n=1 Tax=Pedobacter sp. SYSU D00535 TaxID=2810308 RepID=UPI001A965F8C|nr:tRNA (5-methylaminomethyl-2-thiouridine)(34)-methyltransferase MnmD [Pedobacter sp. SYSU D00535]